MYERSDVTHNRSKMTVSSTRTHMACAVYLYSINTTLLRRVALSAVNVTFENDGSECVHSHKTYPAAGAVVEFADDVFF